MANSGVSTHTTRLHSEEHHRLQNWDWFTGSCDFYWRPATFVYPVQRSKDYSSSVTISLAGCLTLKTRWMDVDKGSLNTNAKWN